MPTGRTLRDIAVGAVFGALLGVLTVVGSLLWSGSMLGFRTESDAERAWPFYVSALGFVGVMAGLLRPVLHKAHGQLLFSFSAMCSCFVGFGAAAGVHPLSTLLVRAIIATPIAFVVGRWGGGFALLRGEAGEPQAVPGSTET